MAGPGPRSHVRANSASYGPPSCPSHSAATPSISPGRVIPSGCPPSRMASTISGASSVSRSTRETKDSLIYPDSGSRVSGTPTEGSAPPRASRHARRVGRARGWAARACAGPNRAGGQWQPDFPAPGHPRPERPPLPPSAGISRNSARHHDPGQVESDRAAKPVCSRGPSAGGRPGACAPPPASPDSRRGLQTGEDVQHRRRDVGVVVHHAPAGGLATVDVGHALLDPR